MIDSFCFQFQSTPLSASLRTLNWPLHSEVQAELSVEITPCLTTISRHCLSNVTLRNTPCESTENTHSWVSVRVHVCVWTHSNRMTNTFLCNKNQETLLDVCKIRIKCENKGKHNILLTNHTISFSIRLMC